MKSRFDSKMEETLKAYKVRADMIEKYKSVTAYFDHPAEYKQRMETEPVPQWEHTELIITRLQLVTSMHPMKLKSRNIGNKHLSGRKI